MILRYKDKQKTESGFTLLEIMIAIVIFSIGLLSIAAMQTKAVNTNTIAFDLSEATAIAETKMEELTILPFTDTNLTDTDGDGDASVEDADLDGDDDDDDDGDPTDDDDGDGDVGHFGLDDDNLDVTADNTADHSDPIDPSNPTYSVFWNIADGVPVPNTTTSKTKTIRVIVNWSEGSSSLGKSVVLDCVKADTF